MEPIFSLRGHTDSVNKVSFSSDGSKLLSADQTGTIKIWNLYDRRCDSSINIAKQPLLSASWFGENQLIAQGKDGSTFLYDINNESVKSIFPTRSFSFAQFQILSPFTFSTPSEEDALSIIDTRVPENSPHTKLKPSKKSAAPNGRGAISATALIGPANLPPGKVPSMPKFDPVASHIVAAFESSELSIFDFRKNNEAAIDIETPCFHEMQQVSSMVAVTGRRLWVGGFHGSIVEVDSRTGEVRERFETYEKQTKNNQENDFGIDSEDFLETARRKDGDDLVDRLPNEAPGELQFKMGISDLAVRPNDARIVISGGWDYLIRIFDTGSRRCLGKLATHNGAVLGVAFSPVDGIFAGAGKDGKISVWTTYNETISEV